MEQAFCLSTHRLCSTRPFLGSPLLLLPCGYATQWVGVRSQLLVCGSCSSLHRSCDGNEGARRFWSTENLDVPPVWSIKLLFPWGCVGSGALLRSWGTPREPFSSRDQQDHASLGLAAVLGRQTCAEVIAWAQQHLCGTNLGELPVSKLQTPLFISLLS